MVDKFEFFLGKGKKGFRIEGNPEEIKKVLEELLKKYGPEATIKEIIEKEFGISQEDLEKKKN